MTDVKDAVGRLRSLIGDGSLDDYWPQVKVADIRTVLDRLEAAEWELAQLKKKDTDSYEPVFRFFRDE